MKVLGVFCKVACISFETHVWYLFVSSCGVVVWNHMLKGHWMNFLMPSPEAALEQYKKTGKKPEGAVRLLNIEAKIGKAHHDVKPKRSKNHHEESGSGRMR